MSTLPLLDPGALDRLNEWGGDVLVARMIDLFLELGPERLEAIQAAVSSGDLEQIERVAHSLKSSAANLGAERLRARAAELESAAISRKVDGVPDIAQQLMGAYRETVHALLKRRPAVDPPEDT